jgi:serine/threonine protein kinase
MWALGLVLYQMVTAHETGGRKSEFPFQHILRAQNWKRALDADARKYSATHLGKLLKEKAAPSLYRWAARGKPPQKRMKEISDLEELLGQLLTYKATARLPALGVIHHPFLKMDHEMNPPPPPPRVIDQQPAAVPKMAVPVMEGRLDDFLAGLSKTVKDTPKPIPSDCREKAKFHKDPNEECDVVTSKKEKLTETRQINGVLYCCVFKLPRRGAAAVAAPGANALPPGYPPNERARAAHRDRAAMRARAAGIIDKYQKHPALKKESAKRAKWQKWDGSL